MTFPQTPLNVTVELQLDGVWTNITGYVFTADRIVITRGRPDETRPTERSTARLTLDNADGRFTARNPTGLYYGLIGRNTPIRIIVSHAGPGATTRFVGEVSSWPPRWDRSENYRYVQIEASGILRRLSQGAAPLRSSVFREFTSPARTNIIAYWPCEDAAGSATLASALPGGRPGIYSGTPELASYDYAASDPLPVLGATAFRFTPPTYTTTGEQTVKFFAFVPSEGPGTQTRLATVNTTGTAKIWEIGISADGQQFQLRAFDADNTVLFSTGFGAFNWAGKELWFTLDLTQVGADISYALRVHNITDTDSDGNIPGLSFTGTLAGNTFSRCSAIHIAPDKLLANGMAVGHVTLADDTGAFTNTGAAQLAHIKERAAARIERLCAEEDIPYVRVGTDLTPQMGNQRSATLLELLQECVEVDKGMLFEPLDSLGLGYRDRVSLTNQDAAVNLSYSAGDIADALDPVDDDQAARNDITVTRKGGSFYRITQDTGPLSTLPPPDGIGRYDDSLDENLAFDSQLPDAAGWRLHLGTVDEARFPVIGVSIESLATARITELMQMGVGDRLAVTGIPLELWPEDVSQLVQGWTEELAPFSHRLSVNCAPESPYRVGELDDLTLGRADTAGSTLAASIGTVSTVAFVADAETNNTTATTSCVVGVPTGTRREDVMVALVGKIDQEAITPPAGWTLIGSQLAGSNVIYEAYYRVAQTSEPANYTWSWSINAKNIGWLGTYRNVDIAAPISTSASSGSNTPGTEFSTPTTSSVSAGVAIIRSVFERHPATGSTNTWTISSGTERMDLGSNGGSGQDDSSAVYDVSISAAGVPAVRTLTASQTVNQVAMWTIVLAPASQMDISVTTTSGPVWTYKGTDLPFDIAVAGEVMTVDLIGDVLNINPYFTVDTSDWSAQNASIARSTAAVHPSGVASMLITPDGVSATGGAQTAATGVGTVTAGRSYIAAGWVNIPTGYSDVSMAVDWYDSSSAFLSSGIGPQYTITAATWTPITATLVAPASASQGRLRVRLGSTPPASALTYLWNAQLIDVTDSSTSPQRMRVTRNVNGVVKSQTSGTDVRLASQMILAL